MQIASWRLYLIKSENRSTCINCRCCVIVCIRLHWFRSSQSWETFDHIHASHIPGCTVLHFYANCVMAAIFDRIGKLFHLQQLQVLCDCLHHTSLIQVKPQLRNLWSHACISHTRMHSFTLLCKLHHGGHILLHRKIVPSAAIYYRCCVIVCITLYWLQSRHSLETFDHIHASLIPECTVLRFYANCVMEAIFGWIRKLSYLQQLQVSCDCLC